MYTFQQKEDTTMSLRRSQAWLTHLTGLTFCMFTLLAFSSIQVPSVFAGSPSFVRVIHASPFVGVGRAFMVARVARSG